MKLSLRVGAKLLDFLDGLTEINANDVMWQWMEIYLDTPLSTRQSLWVTYGNKKYGEYSHEILSAEDEKGKIAKAYVPSQVIKIAGEWTFQAFIRQYSITEPEKYVQAATNKITFTVPSGLPLDEEGMPPTNATIAALYEVAKRNAQQTYTVVKDFDLRGTGTRPYKVSFIDDTITLIPTFVVNERGEAVLVSWSSIKDGWELKSDVAFKGKAYFFCAPKVGGDEDGGDNGGDNGGGGGNEDDNNDNENDDDGGGDGGGDNGGNGDNGGGNGDNGDNGDNEWEDLPEVPDYAANPQFGYVNDDGYFYYLEDEKEYYEEHFSAKDFYDESYLGFRDPNYAYIELFVWTRPNGEYSGDAYDAAYNSPRYHLTLSSEVEKGFDEDQLRNLPIYTSTVWERLVEYYAGQTPFVSVDEGDRGYAYELRIMAYRDNYGTTVDILVLYCMAENTYGDEYLIIGGRDANKKFTPIYCRDNLTVFNTGIAFEALPLRDFQKLYPGEFIK